MNFISPEIGAADAAAVSVTLSAAEVESAAGVVLAHPASKSIEHVATTIAGGLSFILPPR
jgi:hypothetical protein